MKPVDQRVVNFEGYGDCMTSCLAALCEVSYEAVPQFRKIQTEGGSWFKAFYDFLEANGYEYEGSFTPRSAIYADGVERICNWNELPERCEGVDGLYMAGGPSPRGPHVKGGHAVLVNADGTLAFDPHPSREGVLSVENIYMIRRKPASPQGADRGAQD